MSLQNVEKTLEELIKKQASLIAEKEIINSCNQNMQNFCDYYTAYGGQTFQRKRR